MACFATPYGLRYATHCFNRAHAQQSRPALIPAGGKLGVTSLSAGVLKRPLVLIWMIFQIQPICTRTYYKFQTTQMYKLTCAPRLRVIRCSRVLGIQRISPAEKVRSLCRSSDFRTGNQRLQMVSNRLSEQGRDSVTNLHILFGLRS